MPGADLDVAITDRLGEVVARPPQYQDVQVDIPLNDSRTAGVTLPIYDTYAGNDSATGHIEPIRRCLKIRYRDRLVFWGPMTQPEWNLKANTVRINAHDPTIFMKNHYFEETDAVFTLPSLVTIDGFGAWQIARAVSDDLGGAAFPGIVMGDVDSYEAPEGVASIFKGIEVNDNVWDTFQELSEIAPYPAGDEGGSFNSGPDFEFEPFDEEYDPFAQWGPGAMVQLNTYEEKGIDRSATDGYIFHYGWGLMNLDNFEWSPDGSIMRNVFKVGARKQTVERRQGNAATYGIMEGFEARDTSELTQAKNYASWQILAYGSPPNFVKLTLNPEGGQLGSSAGTPPRYGSGYVVGDRIGVVAKKGRFYEHIRCRIMHVTLRQIDQAENVVAELECAAERTEEGSMPS